MALTALLLTFAFGLVRSQLSTFGVCDPAKTTSGSPTTGHPQTCAKFIFCHFEREYAMDCPAGTLFNRNKGICDVASNFDCEAWRDPSTGATTCTSTRVQNFAAPCCGGYYRCERGAVLQRVCEGNRPFNNFSGSCETSGAECTNANRCSYATTAPVGGGAALENCARLGFLVNPEDACGYLRNNSGTITIQKCPAGTLFNMDSATGLCGCIQATSGPCVGQTQDLSVDQCASEAAQFRLRVSNFRTSAVYKGANSWLDVKSGVDVISDAIRFGRTGDNVVLVPFFAGNDRVFKRDFGIQVMLRASNLPVDTDIDVLSNDQGTNPTLGRDCDPSLSLKVRRSNSGLWTVTVEVKDASGVRQSITADVPTNRGEYLRVTAGSTSAGQLSGKLEVASDASLNNAFKQAMTTKTIATPIVTVPCNVGLGRSNNRPNNLFGGEIREFTVFLNCVGIAAILQ